MVTKVGNSKANVLSGTKFKDQLFGPSGNDTLKGLAGNDILAGNAGNDKLTGGAGKDVFQFSSKGGKDIVTDFDVKNDILQIAKGVAGIKTAKDVLDHANQSGKDVVIHLDGGNKITLKSVKLADLKKNPGDHFDVS